jgi:thienamycin biosynthesis protein ThnN
MSAHLREVLACHFDPVWGTPYWLRRERALGIDVRDCIREIEDLVAFGPFDPAELSRFPIGDFLPRARRRERGLVLAETGGTSGEPRPAAYSDEDFHAAFIAPFLRVVADRPRFDDGHWLWLGPGGPHIIGRAAQRIARLTTGGDAFSVDFDPRWFRRLAAGSVARTRYLEHVLAQALRILRLQDIRYLFCTPVVLDALAAELPRELRARVTFVYLGGMPLAGDVMQRLGAEFPAAEFLAGYGNTLFGVAHEHRPGRPTGEGPCYFTQSERMVARIVPLGDDAPHVRLQRRVALGERGQVVMHRLDHSGFLPGVMERDSAVRLPVDADADGLGDPQPLVQGTLKIDSGIY